MNTPWNRFFELLDEVELKFGWQTDIEFWRRYFQWIHLGEEAFPKEAEHIISSGESLVPYFRLFKLPGHGYRQQAQRLYEQVKDGTTTKERYVKGILESRYDRSKIKGEEE